LLLQPRDLGEVLENEEISRIAGVGGGQRGDGYAQLERFGRGPRIGDLEPLQLMVQCARLEGGGLEEHGLEDVAQSPAAQLGEPLPQDALPELVEVEEAPLHVSGD